MQKLTASNENNADISTVEINKESKLCEEIDSKKEFNIFDIITIFDSLLEHMRFPMFSQRNWPGVNFGIFYQISRRDMDFDLYFKILNKMPHEVSFVRKRGSISYLIKSLADFTRGLYEDLLSRFYNCEELNLEAIKLSLVQYANIKFNHVYEYIFEQVFDHKNPELINREFRKIYKKNKRLCNEVPGLFARIVNKTSKFIKKLNQEELTYYDDSIEEYDQDGHSIQLRKSKKIAKVIFDTVAEQMTFPMKMQNNWPQEINGEEYEILKKDLSFDLYFKALTASSDRIICSGKQEALSLMVYSLAILTKWLHIDLEFLAGSIDFLDFEKIEIAIRIYTCIKMYEGNTYVFVQIFKYNNHKPIMSLCY
ncbi:uncharacterized protein VNE69_01086 [Vairimorpha necatrix]|uniref:Uncharacterized protein n=1 Tax=Vairimorpha necatrix TaxID=6039 RepID=A0AAX4J8F8_9MICR